MRNIAKCFAVMGLACIALSSCDNDKFLDVPHYDILDIESQFGSDDNALRGLNGIYTFNQGSSQDNNWGFKPNLFTGSHPTMIPSVQVGMSSSLIRPGIQMSVS